MAEKPKIFTKIFHHTSKRTYRPPASGGGKLYKHTYVISAGDTMSICLDPLYSYRNTQQYNDIYELIKEQGISHNNTYMITGFTPLGWVYATYDANDDLIYFNYYSEANTDNIPSGEDIIINNHGNSMLELSSGDVTVTGGKLRVNGIFIINTTVVIPRELVSNINLTCDIKEV